MLLQHLLEIALFATAVLGLGAFVWTHVESWAFERGHDPFVDAHVAPDGAAPPGSVLGRIEIPPRGVQALVVEGTDHSDLNHAVGHIPGSARFGEKGTVGLAGHRDRHFRGLKETAPGDSVIVTTPHATYVYLVESTAVVERDSIEVLDPVGYPRLTLVTCYPFYYIGPAPRRYVVQAKLLAEKDAT
jgi:sortase A